MNLTSCAWLPREIFCPRSPRGLIGLGRLWSGCRLGRLSPSLRRPAAPRVFACASTSSPATARSHRSNRRATGTTGGPVTTGPIHGVCFVRTISRPRSEARCDQAPLLRFIPLQHTSAASRSCTSEGSRPSDFPASTFGRRPVPYVTRTDRGDARPCGFSLLRNKCGVPRPGGRIRMEWADHIFSPRKRSG